MSTLKTNSIEPVTHSDPLVFRTNATEKMRIDSSGNVIVGATSVVGGYSSHYKLVDVAQTSGVGGGIVVTRSNSVTMESGVDQATGGIIGTRTTHPLVIRTATNERMRIDSSGNVGIGTANPIRVLDLTINSNNSATTGLVTIDGVAIRNINQGSASGNKVTLRFDTSTSNGYTSTIGFAGIHGDSDNNDLWVWSEYWASGLVPSTNTTPIMCFKGSQGTVGINTSAPTAKLQIDGADGTQQGLFVNLNGTDAATTANTLAEMWTRSPVHVKGAGTSTTRLLVGGVVGSAVALQSSNSNGAGALQMCLQPFGGNVGIGTTGPTNRLHIVGGDSSTPGILLFNGFGGDNQTTGGCMGLRIRAGDGSGTATLFDVQDSDGATTHFAVRKDYLVQNNLPMFACRAWGKVTPNGSSNPSSVVGGNISSVTRTSTGVLKVTLNTAMNNSDYAVCASSIGQTVTNVDHRTSVNTRILDASNFELIMKLANTSSFVDFSSANIITFMVVG